MNATQLSVFLENKKGRLAEVTKLLGINNINIRALFIADTSDFGILRMIVDKPEYALEVLRASNFTVSENEIVAVEINDEPGSLANVLAALDNSGLNVEYLYCFMDKERKTAVDIMRIEDISKAIEVLDSSGFKLLDGAALHDI